MRPGFEGGQTPIYRRLPKLRGIAGGMGAGVPDFVVVNLSDLEKHYEAGAVVCLDSVKENVLSVSGREARLPLKVRLLLSGLLLNPHMKIECQLQVLGTGSLSKALTIKAAAFSESAKAAIEAAGGTVEMVPQRAKWTRKAYFAAKAANPNYEADRLKKKVASLQAKVRCDDLRIENIIPAFRTISQVQTTVRLCRAWGRVRRQQSDP